LWVADRLQGVPMLYGLSIGVHFPVLMSPHQSALSLPRAGEMPGSAAQTDARTRSRTDGGHLPGRDASLRIRVAIARVTTRTTPNLTRGPSTPAGPVRAPHDEQARLVYWSPTIDTHLPACRPLYCSCVLSIPRPAPSTDLAIRVLEPISKSRNSLIESKIRAC
jgi:hypothetical protein